MDKAQLKGYVITTEQIRVGGFILAWYLASSLSNNSNKYILSVFPRPMLLTLAQLAFVFLFSAIYLKLKDKFVIFPRSLMISILPLAFANFFTHLLAYIALKDIAVSFINTIKATSPIFTVVLSYYFLKKTYSREILATLVPVVVGVAICTFSELASLSGIVITLFSTLILVSQNIYSKHLFKEQKVNQIALVMNVAGTAFFLNLPLLYFDFLLSESMSIAQAMEENIILLFVLNGFFHFVQNVMAFTILSLVSPVTYSVANTLKRVFVIVLSILYFQNPVTLSNAIGIVIALSGIFLYNRACVKEKQKSALNTYSV